jgi:LPS-assembly lipoprotein
MSSLNARLLRLTAAAALTFSLAACFRPLYGPTASGAPLQSVLASVEADEVAVPPNYERFTHYLRSELVFDLNGSGIPAPKRYRLTLAFAPRLDSSIVSSSSGRAEAAILFGEATYTLTTLNGAQVITTGKVQGSASYERSVQRFATVRAARDAEIRLAKDLADQIRTLVAVTLSSRA